MLFTTETALQHHVFLFIASCLYLVPFTPSLCRRWMSLVLFPICPCVVGGVESVFSFQLYKGSGELMGCQIFEASTFTH